jgi:hypothetical protein
MDKNIKKQFDSKRTKTLITKEKKEFRISGYGCGYSQFAVSKKSIKKSKYYFEVKITSGCR